MHEVIAYSLESFKKKGFEIDPKRYYIVSYEWDRFAEGITGTDNSFTVCIAEGNGYERKNATVLKNKMVKDTKSRNKRNTKGKKNYGCGIVGSCGGTYESVRGNKLEETLEEMKRALSYYYPTFHFIRKVTG